MNPTMETWTLTKWKMSSKESVALHSIQNYLYVKTEGHLKYRMYSLGLRKYLKMKITRREYYEKLETVYMIPNLKCVFCSSEKNSGSVLLRYDDTGVPLLKYISTR